MGILDRVGRLDGNYERLEGVRKGGGEYSRSGTRAVVCHMVEEDEGLFGRNGN